MADQRKQRGLPGGRDVWTDDRLKDAKNFPPQRPFRAVVSARRSFATTSCFQLTTARYCCHAVVAQEAALFMLRKWSGHQARSTAVVPRLTAPGPHKRTKRRFSSALATSALTTTGRVCNLWALVQAADRAGMCATFARSLSSRSSLTRRWKLLQASARKEFGGASDREDPAKCRYKNTRNHFGLRKGHANQQT